MRFSNAGALALLVWGVVMLAAGLCRPLLPIDETRYLTVIWEMVSKDSWVLPTLNFAPYHHKPPLLFWMTGALWQITGPSRAAALVVVGLIALGVTFGTGALARRLWPERSGIGDRAMLLLMGTLAFLVFGSLIMFDVLLTLCVLAALAALWQAAQPGARWWNWGLLGLAIGLGILGKGPVMLLHLAGPALLMPLWTGRSLSLKEGARWIAGLLAALAIGAAIALSWAIPAAKLGGPEFEHAIFWGQSAGRMVTAFDHARPLWWYLPLLPVLLAPWILWPKLWTAFRALPQQIREDRALRFLAVWIVPTFVAFSLISGKQVHYLLPLLPGAILMLVRLLPEQGWDGAARKVVIGALALFVVVHIGARILVMPDYDLAPLAKDLQPYKSGPVAFVRNYQGELGFLARLDRPVDSIEHAQLAEWMEKHPDGVAVLRLHKGDKEAPAGTRELSRYDYRGREILLIAPLPPEYP